MATACEQPEYYNLISQLTVEEKQEPGRVLDDLFCDTNLDELRELMDKILETCLVTDDGPFSKGNERGRLLYLYRKLGKVFEAIFLLRKLQSPSDNMVSTGA